MNTDKNKQIEALMQSPDQPDTDLPDTHENVRLERVMRRVRANVGQRDSLLFAVVKFWSAIAEMVAPIFAQFSERRARSDSGKPGQSNPKQKPSSPQTPEAK